MLSLTAALHGAALLALALAPSWAVFLAAAVPLGFGGGALDGGVNGLYLDLFRTGRGRALNLLHVFFSLGALSAPLVVGRAVSMGVDWRAVLLATGLAAIPVAVLFATVAMPAGRRTRGGELGDREARVRRRGPGGSGPATPGDPGPAGGAGHPPGRSDRRATWPPRSACRTGWSGSWNPRH